ncbi:MAG: glycosyltransferase family 9 protein [Geopsychrobacter sp.]|nr:glycosyltransferase family 9 protein [Geopsychrobacter sp.]
MGLALSYLRAFFFCIVGHLLSLRSLRLTDSRRILLYRPDAIGDFILWLPVAREIRSRYPQGDYEIVLLGNSLWTSLAESQGIFDQVWSVDRQKFTRSLSYRIGLLNRVRNSGFGLVIYPVFSREFLNGDELVRFSSAPQRIGIDGDANLTGRLRKAYGDKCYTRLIPPPVNISSELEKNAHFARGFLGDPSLLFNQRLILPSNSLTVPEMHRIDRCFVIALGAGHSIRQWPVVKFRELACKIHEKYGWPVVLVGGADEVSLGQDFEIGYEYPCVNLMGKTSLEQLVLVINGAKLFVGNESGGIHLAAAVSTPSLCITGGGHFGRFVPYVGSFVTDTFKPKVVSEKMDCFGCNWKCMFPLEESGVARCIANIDVNQAWCVFQLNYVMGDALK